MKLLALDVGMKRTGVAFADEAMGIPLPLDTIEHASFLELRSKVERLIAERGVDQVVVGLPLLPSGTEGAQAGHVREFSVLLSEKNIAHVLRDERYTTPDTADSDGDAAAACTLLLTILSSKQSERGKRDRA